MQNILVEELVAKRVEHWIVSQLSRALSAMDTLRSFKRCGAKGLYRQMSSQIILPRQDFRNL